MDIFFYVILILGSIVGILLSKIIKTLFSFFDSGNNDKRINMNSILITVNVDLFILYEVYNNSLIIFKILKLSFILLSVSIISYLFKLIKV